VIAAAAISAGSGENRRTSLALARCNQRCRQLRPGKRISEPDRSNRIIDALWSHRLHACRLQRRCAANV